MGLLYRGSPLGDDNNLHVLRESDDPLHEIPGEQRKPLAIRRAREKDLRNLVSTREIDQYDGNILTFENPRLDVQVPCKVQVPVDGLTFAFRQRAQIAGGLYGDSETLGGQKIAHTLTTPYQHRRLRIGRHVNQ